MSEREHDYEACRIAREMAAAETSETLRRIRAHRLKIQGDPPIEPPPGFKYIDLAPLDGTYLRLAYRPLRVLDIQFPQEVGHFKNEDGFLGWFNMAGDLLRWPLFWAPMEGSIS